MGAIEITLYFKPSRTLVLDSSKTGSFGSARNSEEFRHAQKFKRISDIQGDLK